MNLAPLTQRFVLHFGEMGSRWGINRTVGQIYALLYVSPQALNADEIGDALMESGVTGDDVHAQARMRQMHDLIELMTGWLQDVQKMDSATLASLMKMGAKVAKLLDAKDKVAVSLGFKARAEPLPFDKAHNPIETSLA